MLLAEKKRKVRPHRFVTDASLHQPAPPTTAHRFDQTAPPPPAPENEYHFPW